MSPMVANSLIAARVDADTKARFREIARGQGVTESALLKRAVDSILAGMSAVKQSATEPFEPVAKCGKISVRLTDGDLLLLRERARTRDLPTATYVSYLIRSHLRNLAPLPGNELAALRQSVAEIGAIGRNLNQIAHAWNRGQEPSEPSRSDLIAILKALTAMRDHTKDLISANIISWKVGQ
jgi:Bacterial mobilisation protein (MobC)